MLERTYYAYSLPQKLLKSLTESQLGPYESSEQIDTPSLTPSSDPIVNESRGKSCGSCSYVASNLADQVTHYKSDWHKFNIKRKVRGQAGVDITEFEKILEELEESISGSGSSDSEDDNTIDRVSDLIARSTLESIQEDEEKRMFAKSPYKLFTFNNLAEDKLLGIYSALFPVNNDKPALDLLSQMQTEATSSVTAIFMIGGGHFAGSIVSHVLDSSSKSNPVVQMEHKTFHRYTTRRKQGGSQSANDNAHGKAHSAGSNLRRYNEQALEKDVRELLLSWKQYIDKADNIFIRANGRQNRSILIGYEGAVIQSRDSRVKTIPFSTGRATGNEVKRVWLELTRVKVIDRDSLFLSIPKPKSLKPTEKKIEKVNPVVVEPTTEELHSAKISNLIKKSDTVALSAYLSSNKFSNFRLQPSDKYYHTPTPLHLAASQSRWRIVSALLLYGEDPTIENNQGRTAWELSGDRATRDAFRIARHKLKESKWDWSKAKVGCPLSQEHVEQRETMMKQEAKLQREKELKSLNVQQSAMAAAKTKKLSSTVVVGGNDKLNGLSAEARLKVERERRARAAEARFGKR
ncbi:hypothetical protein V1514DRAFT_166763 [Lipomyces japonicus]|uniref:uncharacterized protein n=1 Tax=Lipomyces japonicus TaxID=56871 RepID=UPI0034CD1B73